VAFVADSGIHALHGLPDWIQKRLHQTGQLADQLGIPLYLVGGIVRDALLGIPNTDVDLVVEGDGLDFAEHLARRFEATVRAHRRFGTATAVFPDRTKLDLATARSEHYPRPAALPVVQPGSIHDDLGRRDFTVNAMALRLNTDRYGERVDPHHGLDDLRQGLIRVLHPLSFIDDPTRLFRAARLEQRLNFTLESVTERLLREAVRTGLVDRLSGHRVLAQLRLICEETHPWAIVERLDGLQALQAIHPKLNASDQVRQAFSAIDREKHAGVSLPKAFWLFYILALVHAQDEQTLAALLTRLRPDRKLAACMAHLPAMRRLARAVTEERIDTPADFFRHASGLSPETVRFFAWTSPEAAVRERCAAYYLRDRHTRLSIDGHTLRRMGVPQGPAYGRILEAVLYEKINGHIHNEQEERRTALAVWAALQKKEENETPGKTGE
jgi:tRNA nucleotidyltransferase (CCA-adding enzyme)